MWIILRVSTYKITQILCDLLRRCCCLFFSFLGPKLWHMDLPRLGVQLELQLPAYAAATAIQYLSHICVYTTARGNTGSLTYQARPGIEPTSSRILVKLVIAEPQWELLAWILFYIYNDFYFLFSYSWLTGFCQFSTVTHTCIHFFSHIIRLHHNWLDIVLSATQQDLIAYPFQRQ